MLLVYILVLKGDNCFFQNAINTRESVVSYPSALGHAGQNMVSMEDVQNLIHGQQAEYVVNHSKVVLTFPNICQFFGEYVIFVI